MSTAHTCQPVPGAADDIRQAVKQLSLAYRRTADSDLAITSPAEPSFSLFAEEQRSQALRRAEALLFAAPAPLSAQEISEALPPQTDVAAILMELKASYANRGVTLVEVGGAWRFQTAPDLNDLFVETRHEQKQLSQAALETLSIIAYGQPVTRAEIEAVRGVAVSKGTIDTLMQTGWVRIKGRRRTPGKPVTLGTTDLFLQHFGLESLDMLPGRAELEAEGLLRDVIPSGFFADGSDMHHIATELDAEAGNSEPDPDFVTDFMGEAETDA